MPHRSPGTNPNVRSQSKRERFRKAVLAAHGPTCMMPRCLLPTRAIDVTLKAPHPGSYTADHIVTVAELTDRGAPLHLYFDPANGRPAHRQCNVVAGASLGGRRLGERKHGRRPVPVERWRNPAY